MVDFSLTPTTDSDNLTFNVTNTNYAVVSDDTNIQRATTDIESNTEYNCRTFLNGMFSIRSYKETSSNKLVSCRLKLDTKL
jgi:hypothetical protein